MSVSEKGFTSSSVNGGRIKRNNCFIFGEYKAEILTFELSREYIWLAVLEHSDFNLEKKKTDKGKFEFQKHDITVGHLGQKVSLTH